MSKPSDDTAPSEPAKAVPANTSDPAEGSAPPSVPSSPSADTRGGGTSTAEGPSHPKTDVPSDDGTPHETRGAKSDPEVPPPGQRVDDENEDPGDKRTTRQE